MWGWVQPDPMIQHTFRQRKPFRITLEAIDKWHRVETNGTGWKVGWEKIGMALGSYRRFVWAFGLGAMASTFPDILYSRGGRPYFSSAGEYLVLTVLRQALIWPFHRLRKRTNITFSWERPVSPIPVYTRDFPLKRRLIDPGRRSFLKLEIRILRTKKLLAV